MNIIDKLPTPHQALKLQQTQHNTVYRGKQSKDIYLGVRYGVDPTVYLVNLVSGQLYWDGVICSDASFVAIEADVVIKD
jgi:hypothetical protein